MTPACRRPCCLVRADGKQPLLSGENPLFPNPPEIMAVRGPTIRARGRLAGAPASWSLAMFPILIAGQRVDLLRPRAECPSLTAGSRYKEHGPVLAENIRPNV